MVELHPEDATRCGFVAIIGRPNVGKSTLMNHLLGQKLSITSRKPQTTRHQITGVLTRDDCQTVFVDTPGLHGVQRSAMNRVLNRAAASIVSDVDVVVLVLDRLVFNEDDELALEAATQSGSPVILAVNKVDALDDPSLLLPHLDELRARHDFAAIVPLSALRGHNRDALVAEIEALLPPGPFLFPPDQITDRSERFFAAEIVREKVTRQLGSEIPYQTAVEIEEYDASGNIVEIHAVIFVERAGQKRILVGKKGDRIKSIGTQARVDIEKLLGRRVMLKLWVKVRRGWSDDERALRSLGYADPQQ